MGILQGCFVTPNQLVCLFMAKVAECYNIFRDFTPQSFVVDMVQFHIIFIAPFVAGGACGSNLALSEGMPVKAIFQVIVVAFEPHFPRALIQACRDLHLQTPMDEFERELYTPTVTADKAKIYTLEPIVPIVLKVQIFRASRTAGRVVGQGAADKNPATALKTQKNGN